MTDLPGLRGLARRIASGELQGPAAFDAVVALITAQEARPGWTEQQIAQLRDEVVLGVSHDRELCAVLFEHRDEDGGPAEQRRQAADALREAALRRRAMGDDITRERVGPDGQDRPRPQPKPRNALAGDQARLVAAVEQHHATRQQAAAEPMDEDEREEVRQDAARAAERHRAQEARRAAADASRRLPKSPKRRSSEAEDLDEFAAPQRRTRVIGIGIVGLVVVGGLAAWLVTRTGPCELLVKDICFDSSTKDCDPGAIEDALAKGGIDDAACERARGELTTALEGVDNARRSRVFNQTLLESLGFDPRGDRAPPPPPSKEEEEDAKTMKPVPVVNGATGIDSLFIDSSHLYWTRPDPAGVLRARSIGGTPELIGSTPDPIDVTATRDYVYWVSRAGPQTQVWVDPKRGQHEPAPLLTPGFLPQRAAFLGAEYAFVDATGAVLVANVSGGAPRKLTEGGAAPTLLAGDAKMLYFATPAPAGTLSAGPLDGSTLPAVIATGLTDPRALLVDSSGVYWIEGSTGSVQRIRPGTNTVETLATKQSDPRDLALDDARVYWTNAGGGMVMALPKAGGEPVAVATGQTAPTHVVVDGAAVYWVAGDSVMRVPK